MSMPDLQTHALYYNLEIQFETLFNSINYTSIPA